MSWFLSPFFRIVISPAKLSLVTVLAIDDRRGIFDLEPNLPDLDWRNRSFVYSGDHRFALVLDPWRSKLFEQHKMPDSGRRHTAKEKHPWRVWRVTQNKISKQSEVSQIADAFRHILQFCSWKFHRSHIHCADERCPTVTLKLKALIHLVKRLDYSEKKQHWSKV